MSYSWMLAFLHRVLSRFTSLTSFLIARSKRDHTLPLMLDGRFFLTVSLSIAAGAQVSAPVLAIEQTKNSPKVIIASAHNRPPYIIEDDKQGLELAIIRQAFKAVGVEVDFRFSSRKRQHLSFEQHKVDAVMTMSSHLSVSSYWSQPYITYQNVAISLASRQFHIDRLAQLRDFRLTSFLNASKTLGPEFLQMASEHLSYMEISPQHRQNRMLYLDRVDVVIADKYVFQHLNTLINDEVDTSPELAFDHVIANKGYHVLFHDERLRDSFDKGLSLIKQNGLYQQLTDRYLGHYRH
ncbi:amino acid ABC transporter substrate-binding protein [Shewanella sp. WXL01]|uniref:substrate-binding periplasmic protein n=1 Tax=Shewanella sp. WXL01 TaxID=2709721 RepID=UPI0014382E6C|nr:transporter substrate-binding domain-containing protein [Shewanella sp. WXL01]NKF52235.1 amino acid ABC transporter substrate-binding protein [Shewanella sp. WXL01]